MTPLRRIIKTLLTTTCFTALWLGSGTATAQQKTDNADFPLPDDTLVAPIYYGRSEKGFDTIRSGFTRANDDSACVPKKALTLWQNLQTLKNSNTLMGPLLYKRATDLGIYYGFAKQSSTAALWNGYDGTVSVGTDKKYSPQYRLLCVSHETLHGVQDATGAMDTRMSWSIWSNQKECLSTEAAALVGEYLLALDFRHGGDSTYLADKLDFNPDLRTRLVAEFNAAAADSLPYADNLTAVGQQEFYSPFKDQSWLDFYNNWTLRGYLKDLSRGNLIKPGEGDYLIEMTQKTGYLSDDFNFTAGVDSLPANLFGTNTRMKQAFDYAECVRLGRTLGMEDSAYCARLDALMLDKNPYLGLDLDVIYKSADKTGNDVFDVMNDAVLHPLKYVARKTAAPVKKAAR